MLIPFKQLFAKYQIKPAPVLHLGAHYGEEADEYDRHQMRPVVWVEADPSCFRILTQNIKIRKTADSHFALCGLVGDEKKDVTFNFANNQGQSSSVLELGTHAKDHPSVRYVGSRTIKMRTTEELLVTNGLDHIFTSHCFLNIDIQGAELMALKGLGPLIARFDYAYLEVNDKEVYKGCPLLPEMDKWMEGAGFIRRETHMTKAGWGDALYVRS